MVSSHKIYLYLLLALQLISTKSWGQTAWLDSVKKKVTTQKEDTNLLWNLVSLSNAYTFSMPDSGLTYGRRALSLAEKIDFDPGKFWSMVAISGSLYTTGNYALQLDNAFKAQPIGEKLNNPYSLGFSKGMLADAYFNLGEFSTSLQYYRQVLKIGEQNHLPELHLIYSGFAPVFIGLKEYDSAFIYAMKGYSLFNQSGLFSETGEGAKWARSNHYSSLAGAFAAKGNQDSALFYYRLSIPYSEATQMSFNLVNAYNGIGAALLQKNAPDSAAWYVRKAMNQHISKLYLAGLIKSANLLADIYERKNYPDSSLANLRLAIILKDSLYNREKTMAFQNILLKEQEKQRMVTIATLQLKNRYRLYFFIALALSLFIGAGIFIRNRRMKQWQQMRNSIADDLHDDIGSGLSSISILSELAKVKAPEAMPLLTSISESASTIQENMSDIVWSVNPRNDRFEDLLQRMQYFAAAILDGKNIKLHFDTDINPDDIWLTMKQRKNVYLFFKEAINNAAKYSGALNLTVLVTRRQQILNLKISDDGCGFETLPAGNGNGMITLHKRAAELNGRYSVDSQPGKGTTIMLVFKVT